MTDKSTELLPEIQETKPNDFSLAVQLLSQDLKYSISDYQPEPESREYLACIFRMDSYNVRFRSAKITPTKTGQFVTLWKRENKSKIKPFDMLDSIDYIIVSVKKNEHFGVFIFPKQVLNTQNILSGNGKNGKRGFRIYPPWDLTENKQARKTQKWQLDYFVKSSI